MARVVCPSCKAAFEAGISREDYVLNCSACGVAFNAAQYLPDSEFRAICDRRPGAGTKLSYDRGTRAAGNVIRTVNTDSGTRSAINPDTRTGGLPFDDSSESFRAPKPVPALTAAPADPFGARARLLRALPRSAGRADQVRNRGNGGPRRRAARTRGGAR
ncbi:MAG: hypothetical protein HS116_27510 [Planctomycetes bacterium]|nr:hypothetical protein [Planctomycetota bacterium]